MNGEPCPWCGNKELELQIGTRDREGTPVNMMCVECGASGPWAYEQSVSRVLQTTTAIALWNKQGMVV